VKLTEAFKVHELGVCRPSSTRSASHSPRVRKQELRLNCSPRPTLAITPACYSERSLAPL
jgi:hypothetical protein